MQNRFPLDKLSRWMTESSITDLLVILNRNNRFRFITRDLIEMMTTRFLFILSNYTGSPIHTPGEFKKSINILDITIPKTVLNPFADDNQFCKFRSTNQALIVWTFQHIF